MAHSYGAELGPAASAVVNIVTKSETMRFTAPSITTCGMTRWTLEICSLRKTSMSSGRTNSAQRSEGLSFAIASFVRQLRGTASERVALLLFRPAE